MSAVLPRRVVPQPSPAIVPGGDCGACVLASLLEVPVSAVYDEWTRDHVRDAFSWHCLREVLFDAEARGKLDRLIDEVPLWHVHEAVQTYGRPSWCQNLRWFDYVRLAIDAGYYAVAAVDADGRGPLAGDINHWVLIVGAREAKTPTPHGSRIDQQILVSCSHRNPAGDWTDVLEFLRTRGGFNVFLARPA